MENINLLYAACIGYFLGAIPVGVIIASLFNLGNLHNIGSGNIGATNVLRTGNKKAALITLLGDALKGTAAAIIGFQFGEAAQLIAIFFAFIGHIYPIWLKFKGGKGVATYLGTLYGLNPMIGFVATLIWLSGVYITKISAIGALVTALIIPIMFVIFSFNNSSHTLPAICFGSMSCIMFYTHRQNINRLIKGEESKISFAKKE
jgi:glycerol-3-phosphate acyltransferase PlsY